MKVDKTTDKGDENIEIVRICLESQENTDKNSFTAFAKQRIYLFGRKKIT